MGEFGLHLASAAVHTDERLVDQIHIVRVVPRPTALTLSGSWDQRGKLVDGRVRQDGLDPVEVGNAGGEAARAQCRRYNDVLTSGAERSAVLGFLYLFVFSLGMTALLAAVGISSGTLATLPRSGNWMVWIKKAAGVVMLGMAEYYFIQMGQVL